MIRSKQIEYITDKLGELISKIKIKSTLNLTDLNIYSEDFYCQLFNIVYGYELLNTNTEQSNSASIDLGDVTNRIAIQITSTKTPTKTKSTVEKFIEHELYKKYDRLVIFNIVQKSVHKEKKYGDVNYYFDTKNDVWDYKDLTKKINSLDDGKLNDVYEYFFEQFDRLHIITRTVPNTYKNRIKRFRDSYLGNSAKSVYFGGRQSEFDLLNDWINDTNSPKNFLLTSPAGRGKTALLVNWLKGIPLNWLICFMPISIRYETNKPAIFFESLATQLAAILNVRLVSSEYNQTEYYKEKIAEYIEILETSDLKVLIVIDGLDEAMGWEVNENLFSNGSNCNFRIVASARVVSDKGVSCWLNQLGWQNDKAQVMEVPLLSLGAVKELLLNTDKNPVESSQLESYAKQLLRLTSGEPLLLNLYITDLICSAQEGILTSIENLSAIAPGFDAYFKKWMSDQKAFNDGADFDELIYTLLAAFSCAMGPVYLTELEDLVSTILGKPFYLEGDKLAPIQRFLIGDGINGGYTLSHPLFGFFLREEYFKNNRRIEKIKGSILSWGKSVIFELESEKLAPEETPPYLIEYYSQHLNEENSSLDQFEELLCNGWRKAHLMTGSRHLGFIQELEKVTSKANQEYDLHNLAKVGYYSLMLKCLIFSSSINGMVRGIPPKLRSYAIEQNMLTVGQALKQIDTLQSENKAQPIIEIAKYLNSDQTILAINMIGQGTNPKNKKEQYALFLKQLNAEQYNSFEMKINGIIGELSKYKEEPNLATSLSSLIGEDKTFLISELDDKEWYKSQVKHQLTAIKSSSSVRDSLDFIHEFETGKDIRTRFHLVQRAIVNFITIPPVEYVNLLTLHANLILKVTGKPSRRSSHHQDEANVALFLSSFIKLAIEKGVLAFTANFNTYLIQASTRGTSYYESEVILDLYRIFKRHLIDSEASNEVEKNILDALNNLPSGNNRTHGITRFLELIHDKQICKEAISKALITSELIEDESAQVSFLTSVADVTNDVNLKDSILEQAFNICCSINFIESKLTGLISIAKVKDSTLQNVYINEIKQILRQDYPSETKVQYYWQLCELLKEGIDSETYSDIVQSVRGKVNNWERLSWIGFNCIKKFLKREDLLELVQLAYQKESELEGRIELLKNINFEETDNYLSSCLTEVEAMTNSFQKCRFLSLLSETTNDESLYKKVFIIAEELDSPRDKLQAYLSLDRINFKSYRSQIFDKAVNLLPEFDTEREYRRSFLLVLSLKGRTYEFMSKAIDDYAKSDAFEFKSKVLESISSHTKRPDFGDDILISKLINSVPNIESIEVQNRIYSNLLNFVDSQKKLNIFSILLNRKSQASRQEALTFISNNLDYLYKFGGEQLLNYLNESLKEASEWWN